jgi:acyl-CoA reductase-like NAD-dependent aldehyde dehydrogenase
MSIRPSHGLLIDGELVFTDRVIEVTNPATGEVFAGAPRADRALLERAVSAAKAAFPSWSATPFTERVAVLSKLADLLDSRAGEIAQLLTLEQGKPLRDALGEVGFASMLFRSLADTVDLEPEVLHDDGATKNIEHRVALGLVAAIMPWNFPVSLLFVKLAPALLAGDTVVAKPAPTTPLTTCLIGEIFAEVLPPGVLNIICDDNDLGDALTSHPDVANVSFTGSTTTGKKVMASGAATLKRLTLELGGNDPAIVLDDVDPAEAAARVFAAAMMNSGQVCLAAKRVYVPRSIYDEFCDELAALASGSVVGDGLDPATTIGPIQNRAQFEKAKGYLAEAHSRGRVIAGGAPVERPGYFIAPTIVRDIADDSRLVTEEQFSPILPVLSYDDIDDAIARANATPYGLGATVWGRDTERASQVAMGINSGTVWVNQHLAIDFRVTNRGAKESGIGGAFGQEGFRAYTQSLVVNASAW